MGIETEELKTGDPLPLYGMRPYAFGFIFGLALSYGLMALSPERSLLAGVT